MSPPEPKERGADGLVPCLECGRCCTYVAVGINAPRSPRYATDVLWYLYHENVYVYRDGDGEWSVHFETRCRNLAPDLRCLIYERRPHICRAFDNRTCEVNSPEGEGLTLRHPADFLRWLEAEHPRTFRAIARKFVPEAMGRGAPPLPRA